MHNGYVLAPDVIDHNLADVRVLYEVSVPQEEEVASLEGGFHAAGEDDDDGGGRVAGDREALPHHEGGREDETCMTPRRAMLVSIFPSEARLFLWVVGWQTRTEVE